MYYKVMLCHKKNNGLNFRFNKKTLHSLIVNTFRLDDSYKRPYSVPIHDNDNIMRLVLSKVECFWDKKPYYKYASDEYSMLLPKVRLVLGVDLPEDFKLDFRYNKFVISIYLDLIFFKDRKNNFSDFKLLNVNEMDRQFLIKKIPNIEACLIKLYKYNHIIDESTSVRYENQRDFYESVYNDAPINVSNLIFLDTFYFETNIRQMIYMMFHKEICRFLTEKLNIFQKFQFINSSISNY